MAQATDSPYKSPRRKLVRFFEKSRDQWKAKCLTAKAQLKGLQHRMRYLEQSKAQWKERARTLEMEGARLRAQLQRHATEAVEKPEKKTPASSR